MCCEEAFPPKQFQNLTPCHDHYWYPLSLSQHLLSPGFCNRLLIRLPAPSLGTLQSVLHSAARVTFKRWKSDVVILLFKTLQWFLEAPCPPLSLPLATFSLSHWAPAMLVFVLFLENTPWRLWIAISSALRSSPSWFLPLFWVLAKMSTLERGLPLTIFPKFVTQSPPSPHPVCFLYCTCHHLYYLGLVFVFFFTFYLPLYSFPLWKRSLGRCALLRRFLSYRTWQIFSLTL